MRVSRMTEQEMQEQIARYAEGLQESYNKRMKLEKRICELEAENAELKKHCEWLEQNLNLKQGVRRCGNSVNRWPDILTYRENDVLTV